MNRARVHHLVEIVLPKVDPKTFNITSWRCGTVFCAFGHAANDPVFQAEGLDWTENPDDDGWVPVFGESHGIAAAALFFDVEFYTARDWFLPSSYEEQDNRPTVADVITRIRSCL
jgi:hypothetical protein